MQTPEQAPEQAIAWLRTPDAIRQRCELIYAAALAGELEYFELREDRLDHATDYVLDTIRRNYPDLNIPYHSRWRHFSAGGRDRWAELAVRVDGLAEKARIGIELVIISVLLDAGAGSAWRYQEPDGRQILTRSEGLAVASFDWYRQGGLSARPEQAFRVDASTLQALKPNELAQAFQVSDSNPLLGLSGRLELCHRLGAVLIERPDIFGTDARLGNLFDYFRELAGGQKPLQAAQILGAVLEVFSPIWPSRITLGGQNLGDVWRHRLARSNDLTDGLVPFHKLSQWLSYSLVEPLQEAGIEITGLDQLTGLPEYRNGGLFIDLGAIRLKQADAEQREHPVDAELVVEWRALTVSLLDRLAARIRAQLNMGAARLPLAKVLEGGSWSAGRRIARERRPDGSPPLRIISDGTVF